MAQQNALSRHQFKETEFNGMDYKFNIQPGEFVATIDCKRWGKRKKLITYMTFADGRRVVAPTWPRSRYEGLANMEIGSIIRVLYEENRSGTLIPERIARSRVAKEWRKIWGRMICCVIPAD